MLLQSQQHDVVSVDSNGIHHSFKIPATANSKSDGSSGRACTSKRDSIQKGYGNASKCAIPGCVYWRTFYGRRALSEGLGSIPASTLVEL